MKYGFLAGSGMCVLYIGWLLAKGYGIMSCPEQNFINFYNKWK
jgi:hypothetical protein